MTGAARHFPDSYGMGRKRFLDAAKAAGARLEAHQHVRANGLRDEPLYMDVARLGPETAASSVLVLTSGVHGVEGHCGSGIQTGLLRDDLHERLPDGMALVMIHAVNPYGFAHTRRVNEDNVDLNRNFLDHDAPYPDDSAYAGVHGMLSPPDLDTAKPAHDARIAAYTDAHGARAFQAAATGGQWSYTDGLFYGGRAPAWSNTTVREILARHCAGARRIGHIDLHTGLGPFGVGEIITKASLPGCADRCAAWLGAVTTTTDGTSVSAKLSGDLGEVWKPVAPGVEITALTLEFGTRPLADMLDALRMDNWLHAHGTVQSAAGQAIKTALRDTFYPDEAAWKDAVFARAGEVTARMIEGLGAGHETTGVMPT